MDFKLLDAREQEAVHTTLFHQWIFPDGTLWTKFYRSDTAYLLRFPNLADFQVSADGLKVCCWPAPQVSDNTIQHLYLNQVLPLALSKQGKLVFHASAVETQMGVLAFMGESGRGKSTLAASFAANGFRFLTDDSLLLEEIESGYNVQPSHPSIRLWEDSKKALIAQDASQAPPVQYTPKARILFGDTMAFCPKVQPLKRVYFLGDGSAADLVFQRMTPSEALIGLVKNTFLLDIGARQTLTIHFDKLSKMVDLPLTFYRLDYPRRYEELGRVRQAIVEHAREADRTA